MFGERLGGGQGRRDLEKDFEKTRRKRETCVKDDYAGRDLRAPLTMDRLIFLEDLCQRFDIDVDLSAHRAALHAHTSPPTRDVYSQHARAAWSLPVFRN